MVTEQFSWIIPSKTTMIFWKPYCSHNDNTYTKDLWDCYGRRVCHSWKDFFCIWFHVEVFKLLLNIQHRTCIRRQWQISRLSFQILMELIVLLYFWCFKSFRVVRQQLSNVIEHRMLSNVSLWRSQHTALRMKGQFKQTLSLDFSYMSS